MKMNISIKSVTATILFICLSVLSGCSFLNDYQDSGELNLPGLTAPVKVLRDEKGMAYIYAQNMDDALIAQGFVTAQDLYVESIDPENPNHYLEGDTSIPFQVIEEILRIKDKNAEDGIRKETFKIRLTRRGPVVSDVLPQLRTDKVISLRWAPFETIQPHIGYDKLIVSKSVAECREALSQFNFGMLNFVFADKDGDIGWHASGKLPIRSQKDGTVPYVVNDNRDNWIGWIPFEEMPHSYNPKRGWIGTCNHYTPKEDSPYYYSSHASASYRYRRLKQLLESPSKKTTEDHWQFQRDTLNLMAKVIAPIMAKALLTHEDTAELGQMLSRWNFHDDPDKAAPTIFQAVYRNFALLTYQDELGKELAQAMLDNWYFWQERLQKMVLENDSPWFDDISTPALNETRDDLFFQAAKQTFDELKAEFGNSPEKWQWGKIHTIEFVSPVRRDGFGKGLVGGGEHAVGGSAETLMRYYYAFNDPYKVTVFASLRMVADLNDEQKVLAVLPGGVCGRLFHPHKKDQIKSFINGEKIYWWFSDEAIQENTRSTLILNPS
jgi:penicillin amidase